MVRPAIYPPNFHAFDQWAVVLEKIEAIGAAKPGPDDWAVVIATQLPRERIYWSCPSGEEYDGLFAGTVLSPPDTGVWHRAVTAVDPLALLDELAVRGPGWPGETQASLASAGLWHPGLTARRAVAAVPGTFSKSVRFMLSMDVHRYRGITMGEIDRVIRDAAEAEAGLR